MPDEARKGDLRDTLRAVLAEQADYSRYRRTQAEATRGARRRARRARPLEFDESGFPIPLTRPGLASRVARLLGPF